MSAIATSRSSPNDSRHAGAGIILLLVAAALFLPAKPLRNRLASSSGIARDMRVRADISAISTQLRLYESMNGFFPTTAQGLGALVTAPETLPKPQRWYQLYQQIPHDPWQNPYIYRCPGIKNPDGYDLFSAGPDRTADTADDNWGN